MRGSQKPNRSRGRGNRKPNGNNVNRVYESSGPEGKVRGTPQQIIEKYLSLARDAQTSGNRVIAENFLQHAEHYQRMLVEAMDVRQERRDNEQPGTEQPDQDQNDNATASSGDDRNDAGSGEQPDEGAAQKQARSNGRDSTRGNRRRSGDDPRKRDSEVSGLTMIDSSGNDSTNLLVDAEELSASQPKRRPRRAVEPDRQPESTTAPTATEVATPEAATPKAVTTEAETKTD